MCTLTHTQLYTHLQCYSQVYNTVINTGLHIGFTHCDTLGKGETKKILF